jgi:hypothetical protein
MTKQRFFSKYFFTYLFITTFALFLRFIIPQNPRIDTVHDDSLAVELAFNILQGNWLGEWNGTDHPILTLFKPSGYAIFLSASSLTGVPPAVGAMIIYLISCTVLIKYGFPGKFLAGNKIVVYALFAFNPAFYGNGSSFVYRDILSTALITLIIAMSFYILKNNFSTKTGVIVGLTFGLILGFSALLKDDIKYLGFLGFGFIVIVKLYKVLKVTTIGMQKMISLVTFSITTIVAFFILTSTVKYLNYNKYGVYLIEDNNSGNFPVLLSTLGQIEAKKSLPDIYVNKFQIKKAAENSQTFNLLMPYLESENIWKIISCNATKVCDQSGVFFMHELRDAMHEAGLAASAKSFQINSKIIVDELNEACSKKRLECYAGLKVPGIYMSLNEINRKYILDSFFELNKSLLNWEYVGTENPATLDSKELKREHWRIIPGIKWDYEFHPLSETALGLNYFKKFLIWFYQIISSAFLILLFFGTKLFFKNRKKFSYDSSTGLVLLMYLAANSMMILTNVAGWNSFKAAGNYFLIFSPFIVFFYSYIYLALNKQVDKGGN